MTAREVVTLNETTPQLEVPQSGDTYEMPRSVSITGTLACTGAFTSAGIDDNSTGERFQLSDTEITLGATTGFSIINNASDFPIVIAGGTSTVLGSQLILHPQSEIAVANDIQFRVTSTDQLYYDSSAAKWDFKLNTLIWTFTTEDLPFFDFVATADADTTSAISTLTTSGGTTHHIQVDINGVKAWIAVSTTNPS